MYKINTKQLGILHALLNDLYRKIGLQDKEEQVAYKKQLVMQFTSCRAESSKELSLKEANDLISFLKKDAPDMLSAEKMRRKIIAMAHKLRWEKEDGAIDMAAVNSWCVTYGYLHKPLNDYTTGELVKLVSQFRQAYKSTVSRIY